MTRTPHGNFIAGAGGVDAPFGGRTASSYRAREPVRYAAQFCTRVKSADIAA